MKSKEKDKPVNMEEHKEVIRRYLQMNGLKLDSIKVTQTNTGRVYT